MRILALDSSTAACSAAIRESGSEAGILVAHRYEVMARGQSESLAPMVQAVLQDAGHMVRDMDFIAVTTGPGAFTGVRIGLALARAIGLSAGIPVLGVSTMATVAHTVSETERAGAWTLVVMDTKRDDFYAQLFNPDLMPVGDPDIIAPESLLEILDQVFIGESVLIAGDATERVGAHAVSKTRAIRIRQDIILPDAAVVAKIAVLAGPPPPGAPPPSPVYLRPPYAKISPTGGQLRP